MLKNIVALEDGKYEFPDIFEPNGHMYVTYSFAATKESMPGCTKCGGIEAERHRIVILSVDREPGEKNIVWQGNHPAGTSQYMASLAVSALLRRHNSGDPFCANEKCQVVKMGQRETFEPRATT